MGKRPRDGIMLGVIGRLRVLVLQREVTMPGRIKLIAGDLPFDPRISDPRVVRKKVPANRQRQSAHAVDLVWHQVV